MDEIKSTNSSFKISYVDAIFQKGRVKRRYIEGVI